MTRSSRRRIVGLVMLSAVTARVDAEIVEQTMTVPLKLTQATGAGHDVHMLLTVVREEHRAKAPYALLLHGRPTQPEAYGRMGRVRYPANAEWLVGEGFVVLVPTRVGYGLSGGPDLEYTGDCGHKEHTPGIAALVAESRQLLAFARTLPYVDPSHGVVIGESFGGLGAVAIAANPIPGLAGAINFAGGDGGDFGHPQAPCGADRLTRAFAALGRQNRKPVLWLYSRNDLLWGELWPKTWFAAYRAAGGRGRFEELPPNGANGHFVFNRGAGDWHAPVQQFLEGLDLGLHDGRH